MRFGTLISSRGIRNLLGSIRKQRRAAAPPVVAPSVGSEITLVSSTTSVDTKVSHSRHLKVKDSVECFQAADIVKDDVFYFRTGNEPESFVTLRAESTLFRVHRQVLCREGSMFDTLFSKPNLKGGVVGYAPFFLKDVSVDQFKDLLRVLYTFPIDLPTTEIDEKSVMKLPRLLNVAELSRKYGFTAFELWAMEHVALIISAGYSLSSKSKLDLERNLARILYVSLEGSHSQVIDALVPKLVGRILWYDYRPDAKFIRSVERHARGNEMLETLLGVIYYRVMVDMHSPTRTVGVPSSLRSQFDAAEQSLTKVWERLKRTPPPLPCAEKLLDEDEDNGTLPFVKSLCLNPHAHCIGGWMQLWLSSTEHVSDKPFSEADVLGKLKYMRSDFKTTMAGRQELCIECSMGALEVLATLRDEIVRSLPRIFAIH